MSGVIRTAAALMSREIDAISDFREEIRAKHSHELVVTVVYPTENGRYHTTRPSAAGLVDPDGKDLVEVVRVDVFRMPLAKPRPGLLEVKLNA